MHTHFFSVNPVSIIKIIQAAHKYFYWQQICILCVYVVYVYIISYLYDLYIFLINYLTIAALYDINNLYTPDNRTFTGYVLFIRIIHFAHNMFIICVYKMYSACRLIIAHIDCICMSCCMYVMCILYIGYIYARKHYIC